MGRNVLPVMTDAQYAEAACAFFGVLEAWRFGRAAEEVAMAARRAFRMRLDLGRKLGADLLADRLAKRCGAGELEVEAAFCYRYLALTGTLTALNPMAFARLLTPGYTAKERSARHGLQAAAGCLSCADTRVRDLLAGALPARRLAA